METAAVNSRAFDTAPVFTGFAGAGTQPRTESSDVPSSNLSAAQAAQVMSYLQGMQTNVGLLRFPTVDEGLQAQVSSTAAAAPPAASTAAAPSGITSSMMVSPQGIAPPTPQEMNGLAQQYGKVDPAVMQYAQQRGVGITVMHPGDNLEKAGVLRPIDPAELKRKLQTANTLEAPFDAKINENMQQFMTAAAQKGIDPGSPQAMDDPQLKQIVEQGTDLMLQKSQTVLGAVPDRGLLSMPLTTLNGEAITGQVPSAMMAEVHGARSPQERDEFYGLMQTLNGDRLQAAQQEGLANLEANARNNHDPRLQAALEAVHKDPANIPVDTQKYGITVPNMYYYHGPDGKTERYDQHDLKSRLQWEGGQGGQISAQDNEMGGQYFLYGDKNRILVNNTNIDDGTPIHEMGHAIANNVAKDDPGFYQDWHQRLEKAYGNVGTPDGTQSISQYSRTNPDEYLADGFKAYYQDPKLLKMKDGALFDLIAELSQHAAALGQNQPR